MSTTNELKVFISNRESKCDECGEDLGRNAWVFLAGDRGALCLECADLDHLVFLPSGNTALTRRSKKNSKLHAVVLKWSRARKRYERQGLLVEEAALQKAEAECLEDEEARRVQRLRAELRRADLDADYAKRFAQHLRTSFPNMPPGAEQTIAQHACRKHSGRIGRTAAAKQLDEEALTLATTAHIRHEHTNYDELLLQGYDRWDARERVRLEVQEILDEWRESMKE